MLAALEFDRCLGCEVLPAAGLVDLLSPVLHAELRSLSAETDRGCLCFAESVVLALSASKALAPSKLGDNWLLQALILALLMVYASFQQQRCLQVRKSASVCVTLYGRRQNWLEQSLRLSCTATS